jgi:hypothetical protein
MNQKNTGPVYSILILIAIITFIIIFIGLIVKFSTIFQKSVTQYEVMMPLKGNAKNMNPCLPGCIRGTCNTSAGQSNNCKHDFQCQYCQDPTSNMFYANFDNEREIVPIYEEEGKLNLTQTQILNKDIDKNNKYIDLLNSKIMMMNS